MEQPDFSVTASNIHFSKSDPTEGDSIDVDVLINNLTKLADTNDISVRLFDGDPEAGGVQIGASRVIANGLPTLGEATVTFNAVAVGNAGIHNASGGARAICQDLGSQTSNRLRWNCLHKTEHQVQISTVSTQPVYLGRDKYEAGVGKSAKRTQKLGSRGQKWDESPTRLAEPGG